MANTPLIIAYIGSNVVAIILLLLSLKRKNLARILFSILFIWASWINWKTAHSNPAYYLDYGKYAIGFYKTIINGEFARHISGYVSLISICQLMIGLGLLIRDIIVKLSCIGGIIFLLAIAPLGFGSALPFSIIASVALFVLYRHNFSQDIFKNKWWV